MYAPPFKKGDLKVWLHLSTGSDALHTFLQNSVPNDAISHPSDVPGLNLICMQFASLRNKGKEIAQL